MDGYRKIKMLGKGTYGNVYICERKRSERKVVLKEINIKLNDSALKAANNEINILKSLNHPNIIKYFTHFVSPRFFCIIMEYARKGSLYEMVLLQKQIQNTYICEQTVLNMFCQILLAVDYLHSKHIIHRDLKCENILITGSKYNIIKIADFGISKLLESNGQAMTVIGTPNYLAPEICNSEPYNEKCDIWALGCILFELCALERMFDGSISNVVLSIAKNNIKQINLNVYDVFVNDIIKWCLVNDPTYRPSTSDLIQHPKLLSTLLSLLVDVGRIPF